MGVWGGRGTQGQRSLTISLDHMTAVIADVSEELWTEQLSGSLQRSHTPAQRCPKQLLRAPS